MVALTGYLMAAVLAVSLMFAPVPALAEAQVECAKGIRAEPRHCAAVMAEFDAMRDLLANPPPDYTMIQVMDRCTRGLVASVPGYDPNTYINTCGHLLLVLQGH